VPRLVYRGNGHPWQKVVSQPGEKWSIIAASVLLSPVLVFLFTLAVVVLLGVIEAGLAASLAAIGAGSIAWLGGPQAPRSAEGRLGETDPEGGGTVWGGPSLHYPAR
jgi:hypothetical protein